MRPWRQPGTLLQPLPFMNPGLYNSDSYKLVTTELLGLALVIGGEFTKNYDGEKMALALVNGRLRLRLIFTHNWEAVE